MCRGFSGVDILSVDRNYLHWTWFYFILGFKLSNQTLVFTLNWDSKRLSTQTMVFTLYQISHKNLSTQKNPLLPLQTYKMGSKISTEIRLEEHNCEICPGTTIIY